MQRKTRNTLLSRILCMMLIVAMALTSGCGEKKQQENPSSAGQEVSATKLGEGKTQFNFTVVDKDGKETAFDIHTDKTTVGDPTVKGVKVKAKVVNEKVAGDKVRVIRYHSKKRVHTETGHRQKYSEIEIVSIA